MKVLLVRHGQSMGNVWSGAYSDDRMNFLSLRGIKETELCSFKVNDIMPQIDVVFTSELTRARQTAVLMMQSIGNWKRDYIQDIKLNEWCWEKSGSAEWFNHEKSKTFWNRVEDFWKKHVNAYKELDLNIMIVSHHYTTYALIELFRRDLGLDNEVGQELDPEKPRDDIPNAMPFLYDTDIGEPPKLFIPGFKR